MLCQLYEWVRSKKRELFLATINQVFIVFYRAAATFSVRPKTSSTGFQPSNPTKENRPHSSAGTEVPTGGFKLLETALSGPLRSKPVTPNVPRRNNNGKNFFKKRRSNAVEHCGDYSELNDKGTRGLANNQVLGGTES